MSAFSGDCVRQAQKATGTSSTAHTRGRAWKIETRETDVRITPAYATRAKHDVGILKVKRIACHRDSSVARSIAVLKSTRTRSVHQSVSAFSANEFVGIHIDGLLRSRVFRLSRILSLSQCFRSPGSHALGVKLLSPENELLYRLSTVFAFTTKKITNLHPAYVGETY